ncbi:hypothetical protein DERF_014276 [Dermatophagoides farinae]|uniref:Uncharacterized protein n=1 Tax=Dermatophagoides farinae TaxID=6954 RepID=A0A922HNR1_DERFA|nr:hypothetical protein DERF_014276 [Dermatophagoides farinae]
MPQIVQSTIKTRNLSISGIFVDLLQLVAMNDWLFHYLIRTFKHEKRKQAKFWIHPKRPRNHESDMRPLSSSKVWDQNLKRRDLSEKPKLLAQALRIEAR